MLEQMNNNIKWSSRWDYILESMPHTNIQWFRSVYYSYDNFSQIFE